MDSLTTDQIIRTLASYVPPAVARDVWTNPQRPSEPQVSHFPAAVLLCDISGFTALTERLAVYGASGAEELIQLLNAYYSRMIGLLEAEGGETVQFSGDALTAVFPAAPTTDQPGKQRLPMALSVRRAWQAAEHMQAAMEEFATLQTSAGTIKLGMKIVIGCGVIAALSVGGMYGRWQYIIAGDPLRQVTEEGQLAERGETRLSPEARQIFPDQPVPSRPLLSIDWRGAPEAVGEALRNHIPRAITQRLMAGQTDWLAELRRMSILFIGVNGLKIDTPNALQDTQLSMLTFQETVYRYEGSINKLLVDDKGVICIVLFGAPPLAHLDDPFRAIRCALDLIRSSDMLGLRLAIGITTGQVFAGPLGSPSRREYTVMGDVVNMAARLMQTAGPGGIRCDHATYQAALAEIDWESLPPQHLKGKSQAVRIYRPLGLRTLQRGEPRREPLLGRDREISQIAGMLDHVLLGQMQVLFLSGSAGIGKSRLVDEIDHMCRERGLLGLFGQGEAVEQQVPYHPWIRIFSALLELGQTIDPQRRRAIGLARVEELVGGAADDDMIARLPLLNDLLHLDLPETALTGALEPEPRRAALASLLIELLHHAARSQPLLLLIDDVHWLDSLSWELAYQIARELSDRPIALILALRPTEEPGAGHQLSRVLALPHARTIELGPLGPIDTMDLAALCLDVDGLPEEFGRLIQERAGGNPFLIKELAHHLRDSGAVSIMGGRCVLRDHTALNAVPETIQGLVLSRIDRLPVDEQLTIKVASVIGRTFSSSTLLDIYPDSQYKPAISDHLKDLALSRLIEPLQLASALYSHEFNQSIIQEVTYGTLLVTQRRLIHARLAGWFEEQAIDHRVLYPLLAHHWRQAGVTMHELRYAELAAKTLAAEYANEEALRFLERALELSDRAEQRFSLYWLRLQIHESFGDTVARHEDLTHIETLATGMNTPSLLAQTWNAWADLYRDTSDYTAAIDALDRAAALAHSAGDPVREARSLTIRGQVMEYQGDFRAAQRCFEQALAIYRAIGYQRGEATNLSQLGNIAHYLNDYQRAQAYELEALQIRRAIGDRASEAISLSNLSQTSLILGATEAAREYGLLALQIARSIGNRSSEALSLGMIGDICFAQGDYAGARQHLEQALRLFHAHGERRRAANCQNVLGQVWRDIGELARAQSCFEDAISSQIEIGDMDQATYSLLNLGYTFLDEDPEISRVCYEQALGLATELDNSEAQGYALSYQGLLYERTSRPDIAERQYLAALTLRSEHQMEAASIEDHAGLGRIAMARNDLAAAAMHADACLHYLAEFGTEGIEFPVRVALSCFDILCAAGNRHTARRVLDDAQTTLLKRADAIHDPIMREHMLMNIIEHRRLLAEVAALDERSVGLGDVVVTLCTD